MTEINEKTLEKKNEKNQNELKIIYSLPRNFYPIKLFDEDFISVNKDKAYLIINNTKSPLISYYKKSQTQSQESSNEENELKVTLIEDTTMEDISRMFSGCNSFKQSKISKTGILHIKNMNNLFADCDSKEKLPEELSLLNTSNFTDMREIFSNCTSLKSIPNIKNWNVSKVTGLNAFFYEYEKTESLSDISEWDISNVSNIGSFFSCCKNLKSIPDISK